MILGTSCIVTVQKETRVLDSGLFFVILTLISSSFRFVKMQFTALSGRHSVLERPLSGENGRPFLVITPEIIGY